MSNGPVWVNSKFSWFLLGTLAIGMASCTPDDPSVRRNTSIGFERARAERVQVSGVDYLEYSAYRLSEVSELVKLMVEQKGHLPQAGKSNSPCARLELDRNEGSRRLLRLRTNNCKLERGELSEATLKADGDEIVDVFMNQAGKVSRIVLNSVGPRVISGSIAKGDLRGSDLTAWETRQMALDENGENGFRFSYSVEMTWRQTLSTKAFKAFDEGKSYFSATGDLVMADNEVKDIAVDLIRMNVNIPRDVQSRSRKNNRATNRTYHNVDLLMRMADGEQKGTTAPLVYDPACGLPSGRLRVLRYSSSFGDKISSREATDIQYSPMGVFVPSSETSRPWTDCKVEAGAPGEGGAAVALKIKRPTIPEGEIGVRAPYVSLFFR